LSGKLGKRQLPSKMIRPKYSVTDAFSLQEDKNGTKQISSFSCYYKTSIKHGKIRPKSISLIGKS